MIPVGKSWGGGVSRKLVGGKVGTLARLEEGKSTQTRRRSVGDAERFPSREQTVGMGVVVMRRWRTGGEWWWKGGNGGDTAEI